MTARVVEPSTGRVSIAGQEVRTVRAIPGVAAGADVTLAVRPEGMHLGAADATQNQIRGSVEDINFLGSVVRLRVHLPDVPYGPGASLTIDKFNEPHLTLPAVGEDVTVAFPPEACFVLGNAADAPDPAVLAALEDGATA